MSHACDSYRDAWLEAALGGDGSRASAMSTQSGDLACPACVSWRERAQRLVNALRALEDRRAPAALDRAVQVEVQPDAEERFARILGSLPPLDVPAELDVRVAEEGHLGAFLRTMPPLEAPSVLERLVEEELADPALARMRRFPGDLERLDAPKSLAERLGRRSEAGPSEDFAAQERPAPRRLGSLLAAAAAAFALWLGVRSDRPELSTSPEGEGRSYRFEVRYATASMLDPLASGLGGALSGGSGYAIAPAPSDSASEEGTRDPEALR